MLRALYIDCNFSFIFRFLRYNIIAANYATIGSLNAANAQINNLSADIATIQSVVSVGGISTNGYVHAQSGVFGAMTVNGGTLKQVSGVLINGTRYNLWTW